MVATGFARPQISSRPAAHTPGNRTPVDRGTPVIPIDGARPRPVIGSAFQGQSGHSSAVPAMRRATPLPERRPMPDMDDLEIPTFIRRQMD